MRMSGELQLINVDFTTVRAIKGQHLLVSQITDCKGPRRHPLDRHIGTNPPNPHDVIGTINVFLVISALPAVNMNLTGFHMNFPNRYGRRQCAPDGDFTDRE